MKALIRHNKGFTLVELILVMAIMSFIMVGSSRVLISMVNQFKQESRVAESTIESTLGLDILRYDLQHAGSGLPRGLYNATSGSFSDTNWGGLSNYVEYKSSASQNTYDDAPSAPPRAIVATSSPTTHNKSDYLVIKSDYVSGNEAAGIMHTLNKDNVKNTWLPSTLHKNLEASDRVIVISIWDEGDFGLVHDGGLFWTYYDSTLNFAPDDKNETRMVFGIDSDRDLSAPFNRADYYISITNVPSRCAKGTGVLVKSVMQHNGVTGGTQGPEYPLLDCVADFQLIFRLDTNNDGEPDMITDTLTGYTAEQIRSRLKEVRAYILAHEGQYDPKYSYPDQTITLGDTFYANPTLTRTFNLGTDMASDDTWKYYRWRIYTLVESPTLMIANLD